MLFRSSAAAARYENPLVRLIPFSEPAPSREIAIVWRKSYGREQAVEKLAESIRAIDSPYMQIK